MRAGLVLLLGGLGIVTLQVMVIDAGWLVQVLLGLLAACCIILGTAVLLVGPRRGSLPLPDGRLRFIDERSSASNAGGAVLSLDLLSDFHPWLASGEARHAEDLAIFDGLSRDDALRVLQEHIACGDCRGAVVAGLNDDMIIVAAYSDDFDACVFLAGGPDLTRRLVGRHRLQRGSRLITCNTFTPPRPDAALQEDIIVGERAGDSPWIGVWPVIVDFLCDDRQRLAELHAGIDDDEWNRIAELAFATYPGGLKLRPLEPFLSMRSGAAMAG